MTKKYIDAKDARTVLEKLIMSAGSIFDQQLAYDSLDSIPAADVEEVKYAAWKPHKKGGYYCSNCKMDLKYGDITLINRHIVFFKYCPKCGAHMDRKEQRNG